MILNVSLDIVTFSAIYISKKLKKKGNSTFKYNIAKSSIGAQYLCKWRKIYWNESH